MLSRTTSEQYVDSRRCTLGRLERGGDFNDPWIAEFKHSLLERIAELGRVDENSVAKSDCFLPLTEPMRISKRPDANRSFREIVLLFGSLVRSGAVAYCIVRATKVTIPSLQDSEYVDAEVVLAPQELPDGQYELHFEGRNVQVGNNAGCWSTLGSGETPQLQRES
jgi:hypothetical protein